MNVKGTPKKVWNFLSDWATQKKYPMPDAFISIDYTGVAKLIGITDDIVKEIRINIAGEEPKTYPYSEAFLRVMSKEKKLPVFDATKMQHSAIEPIVSSRPDILEMWR